MFKIGLVSPRHRWFVSVEFLSSLLILSIVWSKSLLNELKVLLSFCSVTSKDGFGEAMEFVTKVKGIVKEI